MVSKDPNCLFCKIIDGQIPASIVQQTEDLVVIKDINPQAPAHLLIIPKAHHANVTKVEDAGLLGRLFQQALPLQKEMGLDNGFRLVVNTGDHGGQTVDHLHIHLLGGRPLSWPPG